MLKPTALAWQNAVNQSFKLSILTAALASIGILSGCTSTPQTGHVSKTKSVSKSDLLDADSFDSLEDLLYATDMRAVESDRLQILRHGDVWKRMTVGFKLNLNVYNPRIDAQRSWFISRQPYLDRLSARASRYLYYTVKEAERRGIPTELALLPVIESSYDPAATSSAAAAGLWQFIPSTGKIYGLRQSELYDGRRDVVESTRAAYEYLTSLYNQFGSWELALASYNAGPGRIQQAINRNIAAGLPTDYWSLKLPTETMNYVPRFLAVAQIISKPHQYGVALPPIANRPHFREVEIPGSIDLNELSQLTGVSRGELYALNPAHRGNYTDPLAPRRILIPNEVSASVDNQIAKMRTVSGSGGLWAGGSALLPTLPAATPTTSSAVTTQVTTRSPSTTTTTTPVVTASTTSARPNIITQATNAIKQSTPKGSNALAQFAANADVPSAPRLPVSITPAANVKQIAVEPPISAAEKQAILANDTTLSTANLSTAKQTQIVDKIVEPAPTDAEKLQVVQELEKIAPKGTEIVDPMDGKIRLTAIQSSQSIAEQKGEDVKITYAYPKAVADAERKTNSEAIARNTGKPAFETRDEVVVVAPKGKRDVYTVQSGDTLATIAAKYGISWRDIATWNQINAESPLFVGTRLYLYDVKPVQSSAAKTASKTEKYVVKAGDSLTSVSQQFDVSIQDLAAWNNLSVTSNLLRGQSLTLVEPKNFKTADSKNTPTSSTNKAKADEIQTESYTVKRGEYLKLIADRYNISNAELAALTPNLTASSNLLVGQKINVPKQTTKTERNAPKQEQQSNSTSSINSNIKTTTYTVVAGDYLSTVAQKNKMSLSDLAALNNLNTNSTIFVGQKLKVAAQEPERPATYKVQSGDTLTSIANKFDITVQDLADLNGLSRNARITRGATLKLEGQKQSVTTQDNSKAETSNTSSNTTAGFKGATETYSVKSGESLTVIANRYGLSVGDLADLNNLKSNSSLRVGQKLKVPKLTASYKVKSGDSLIRLAKNYGISTEELAEMNNLKPNSQLQLGQTITVPNK
ncbi:MAG: LysM peptidoglycan-binding domain-containing protein [Acinetobacter populi]|jgi:LysM repeat protein|uniref:LysM peptidoglycan-binding domain-containing protein n=1 Tax=Acinetobacter populi TaxID=1582270 RepID=UPI002353998A|nr:LysM peptidoglycan-binding domain-containing protein [Acinetobacter populi]MCH4246568.1 LysM peptidoglycan-binding domain-containing protein [Acinetobacter populi]